MTKSIASLIEKIADAETLLPVDQLHQLSDMPPAFAAIPKHSN